MLDLLANTPQTIALADGLDIIHDQRQAAADAARDRYERGMINEAFLMAAGHSDTQPHIEHIRLLCELVARHHASRPSRIPF